MTSMRVALTGSSSTGKTTLAVRLHANSEFRGRIPTYCSTDARELLKSMGHGSIDEMQPEELRDFREHYYLRKLEIEAPQDNFLTDRSFVDVAAYWIELDAVELSPAQRQPFVERCLRAAAAYDLHVYCPFGLIPFEPSMRRSRSQVLHRRVDRRIRGLLEVCRFKMICLAMLDFDERVAAVSRAIAQLEKR